jgi:magnesium chelatase subunit D
MKNPKINSHRNTRLKAGKLSISTPPSISVYPFSAIVGQDEMKLALVLNIINPVISGVVIMGERGTGKSTAVRALAELLPPISVVPGCSYQCDPSGEIDLCDECKSKSKAETRLPREQARVHVVDLPLGATEDRVCGTIDIERALRDGKKSFEPGLLARANRGFLYIDEVNLLEDHLVDLLLDVATTGRNKVERESMSIEHPARFVLIGSGNPEEGELRPQLLDRFGLHVEVHTENDLEARMEIVERRESFDRDPLAFAVATSNEQQVLRNKITRAQKNIRSVVLGRPVVRKIAQICADLKIDGHRGELTISRAARALAAFEGRKKVMDDDVRRVAPLALRHRLRRDPLEEIATTERIQQALDRLFPEANAPGSKKSGEGNEGANGDGPRDRVEMKSQSSRTRGRAASASGALGADAVGQPIPQSNETRAAMPRFPADNHSRHTSGQSLSPRSTTEHAGVGQIRNSLRGRYVRATATNPGGARVALDATLRAMATSRSSSSLRFKELSHKQGRLFIFAIDTSGSMATHRIGQASAAVLSLLRQSYVRRDSVAIVGIRGKSAEILLPPSRSIVRARRALESLRVGGGTPLSAGLAAALDLARSALNRDSEVRVLLFTDGRANVPAKFSATNDRVNRQKAIAHEFAALRGAFAKIGIKLTVVDTQHSFVSNREALNLAERLGASYTSLPLPTSNLN